jgi:uncharacterized protein with NRDE domain
MCLLLFAYEAHPRYSLIVAANRDEWLARPADQAHAWNDAHHIVAGVDREAGGTWLGVTETGRFAALTNYRDPRDLRPKLPDEPSRGALVRDFLESSAPPEAHLRRIAETASTYRGFNLVAGDLRTLAYLSNRAPGVRLVEPGIHGLSNELLDTPWPKVRRGAAAFRALIKNIAHPDPQALLAMLEDEAIAPDDELPDTGVGLEMERKLSPIFLRLPLYGTRCSTVLLVERAGRALFIERTHAPERLGDVQIEFQLRAG